MSYHGKSITIGDELAIVGSFNMDMRSAYLDTELMLVVDSKEVTSQLKGYMEAYEADSVKSWMKRIMRFRKGSKGRNLLKSGNSESVLSACSTGSGS